MYIFHVVKYVSLCSMHVYTYKLNIHINYGAKTNLPICV